MSDMVPQEGRPIRKKEDLLSEIEDLRAEVKRLKAQSTVPLLKAFKDEVIERAKSGKLREELKGKKVGSLLRDLSLIKTILEENVPQVAIITPPAPASEGKDVVWQRANSVIRKTESERKKLREAIDTEAEK